MKIEILVNHIGFVCKAKKEVIVKSNQPVLHFEVQDMSMVASESFDEDENWQAVFKGELKKASKKEDTYVGDFSSITKPGIYSVLLPKLKKRSYQFVISDGAFHHLPWLFVDFLNFWKSPSETNLKVQSTVDDGLRSDNEKYHPVKSGWYDAGDLRKWMTHTNLPAAGFYELAEKPDFHRNYFHGQQLFNNDLLTVSNEAVNLILEMQDPETGKIFECLGAGGLGRADDNMSWWYENHSGCLADNSDNRFTDNKSESGDERTIRTDYNALIQYTSIYILLRSVNFYKKDFPEKAERILQSVQQIVYYAATQSENDPLEKRTAVKSWKLQAMTALYNAEMIKKQAVLASAVNLLKNFRQDISFWCQDEKRDDPYRGILHSAQPVIALIQFLKLDLSDELKKEVIDTLQASWKNYIQPLLHTNVLRFMPYGTWFNPATEQDIYKPFKDRLVYRNFMPAHSKQKINHGLNGHYMSWAHALALAGNYFGNNEMIEAAWNQIYFAFGRNDFNVSFVSGIGFNNPMPHSRFLGTTIGGFMAGFIGNTDDSPYVDLKAKAQWNTTEYWNTPIGNLCMALAELLPKEVKIERKLGRKV